MPAGSSLRAALLVSFSNNKAHWRDGRHAREQVVDIPHRATSRGHWPAFARPSRLLCTHEPRGCSRCLLGLSLQPGRDTGVLDRNLSNLSLSPGGRAGAPSVAGAAPAAVPDARVPAARSESPQVAYVQGQPFSTTRQLFTSRSCLRPSSVSCLLTGRGQESAFETRLEIGPSEATA